MPKFNQTFMRIEKNVIPFGKMNKRIITIQTENDLNKSDLNEGNLIIGAWLVNPLSLRLIKEDKNVKVQPKVMKLLLYLAKSPEKVILREQLIAQVWPEVAATDDTLNNMIGKLRRVLVADESCQNYIETIPKQGYCLRAKVTIPKIKKEQKNVKLGKKTITFISFSLVVAILFSTKFFVSPTSTPPFLANIDFSKSFQTESITSHQALEVFPALSPNSKNIAFIRVAQGLQQNKLIIKNIATGNERELNDIEGLYGNPVWSANGEKIAYIHMVSSTCTVRIVDMRGGPSQFLSDCSGELIRTMRKSLTWNHKENTLIFTKKQRDDNTLALFSFNVASKNTVKLTSPPANLVGDANPAVSPNGKWLVYTRTDESGIDKIMLLNLANTSENKPLLASNATTSQAILGVDWLDNDSIVFVTDANNRSQMVSVNINLPDKPINILNGTSLLHPKFNQTNKELVFAELRSNANIVIKKRTQVDSASVISELKSSKFEREVIFANSGLFVIYIRLLSNGSELWLYDIAKQKHQRLVKPNNALFRHISISPDDSKVVFTSVIDEVTSIQIYDIAKQHFFKLSTPNINKPLNPSWSSDNKTVLFTAKNNDKWQIWRSPIDSSARTLLTEQGGNVVVEDKSGENLYFSRQSQAGLWQLPLKDLHTTPNRITDKITEQFQRWKMVDNQFYFLKRESIPSSKIYIYDRQTDQVNIHYQSTAAFNYFDINKDKMATAELKEFTADIYLIKFK